MPTLYGRYYTRAELLQRVGRLDQVAGIEASTLSEGRAAGTRVLRVRTGAGLDFTVVPDRCLDVAHAAYNGRALSWISANGVVAPTFYDAQGQNFLRSFVGGLLTTCGLRNFGPPCTVDGEEFSMHGRVGNLPAEDVAWGTAWDGDECTLWIEGTVRESRVFGENLTLHRRIEARVGETSIRLVTTIRNEGWRPEGHMILFHMNPGFPLLDEGATLLVESREIRPRDEEARRHLALYDRFDGPTRDFKEQVFIHDLVPDQGGYTTATLINERLDGGLGLRLRFPKEELPFMVEWRQLGEEAYVVGLEPANTSAIEGRAVAAEKGILPVIAPGEARRYTIEVDVLAGRDSLGL